jgi:UDP-N-acetyl-D-mannosaminuronic acid dehydrogenase
MHEPSVCIIGLGYIGLPTAIIAADHGLHVRGVDINPSVVETINQGRIHIVEPGLSELCRKVVEQGALVATTTPCESDVYLIVVPTPFKENNEPDISYVEAATRAILPLLKPEDLIIIESTSPVGTTEKMATLITEERPELAGQFHMAYCPERVLPGNVIHELIHNDRVIGGMDEIATERAIAFYRAFVKGQLHPTNARTAEMCKLVENSSRDAQIAFANELSIICDKAGVNVWELIELANKHPRVNILQPGCGVGGHCIAVDPWFLVSNFPAEANMIAASRNINNYKTDWVIERIKREAAEFERDHNHPATIACLGLAFKPDIDDLRESPALRIVRTLIRDGYTILAVEPNIPSHPDIPLTPLPRAIQEADIIAILVKHTPFIGLTPAQTTLDFCGAQ